jgi:hypothetical protein
MQSMPAEGSGTGAAMRECVCRSRPPAAGVRRITSPADSRGGAPREARGKARQRANAQRPDIMR